VLDADETIWDQNAFNDIFRRVVKTDDSRSDRLFWCAPLPCHLACRVGLAWDKGTRARVQSGLQGGLPAAERAAAAHAMLASGCAEQGVDLQPKRCHPAAGAVVQHAYLPPAGLVWLMLVRMELSSRPRKPRLLLRSAASRMCRPGSWRLHGSHARRKKVYGRGLRGAGCTTAAYAWASCRWRCSRAGTPSSRSAWPSARAGSRTRCTPRSSSPARPASGTASASAWRAPLCPTRPCACQRGSC